MDRSLAQKNATDKWDGSEMYQMFIGTRIIAQGGRLLGLADITVGKNVQVPGEEVDSYMPENRSFKIARSRKERSCCASMAGWPMMLFRLL